MARRLPPAPADTRLARFVGRLLARWPLVSRSTLRMEMHRKDAQISNLRDDLAYRDIEIRHLHDTCRVLMRRLAPPVPTLRATRMLMDEAMTHRIKVEFDPVYYDEDVREMHYATRSTDAWIRMVQGIAHEMSLHHARQVEQTILDRLAVIMPMRSP